MFNRCVEKSVVGDITVIFFRNLSEISRALYVFGCHLRSDQSTYVTDQFEIPPGSSILKEEEKVRTSTGD